MYTKALVLSIILCGVVLAIPPSIEISEQTGIAINNHILTENSRTPNNPMPLADWTNGILMIPDWTTDSIGLFDPYDGTFLRFLTMASTHASPKNAIQGPDGNIYLSDQVTDEITMFDTLGTYLGIYADASDGLDNMKGIAFRGDHLFACCNLTSGQDAVKELSGPHSYLRDFIAYSGIDAFDILFLPDGKSILADAGTTDQICLYDTNGTFINQIYYHGSSRWPQQIQTDSVLPGAFLGALWDADTIIDFDLDGTVVNTCTLKYVKGVYRLGNGHILATSNYGIWDFNTTTGEVTQTDAGTGWQYIELYKVSGSPTPTCTINVNIEGDGVIIPSGMVIVNQGSDTTFSIIPGIGHHLDSLVVDGENHGPDSTLFRFENVMVNHIMTAYFSINNYTINATATTGGTITPSGSIIVEYGMDTTFLISANIDYLLDSVLVDGVSVGAVPSYTFTAVDDNHTIHAMFSSTGIPGWAQMESVPAAPDVKVGKYVKDGGAMTVAGLSDQGEDIYTFYGNKSKQFYKYSAGIWSALESIPYGVKSTDPLKINKKTPKKSSALCWDGDNTIFAAKGNTNEFWAYYIDADTWVQKAFVPVPKKYKGGTSITFYAGIVYLLAGNQKTSDPTNFYSYVPAADTVGGVPWTSLTGAPLTPNNKKWKDGSGITAMSGLVYALKGGDKYNVFCAYSISGGTWQEIESLPLTHPMIGKKVKVKDGGAVATDGSVLYAIKGGGKQDFWMYTPATDAGAWTPLETIPRLWKKSVPKAGAALTYAEGKIWLMKGNNSLEFWRYLPSAMSKVICQMSKPPHTATAIQAEPSSDIIPVFNVVPNPFAKNATIRYSVPVSGRVVIKLYNTNGSLVKTLNDAYVNAGTYTINLSAATLAKGIYFVRFDSETCKTDVKLIIQ
jgi:hypothetical protein